MTATNWDSCLAIILKEEGGNDDDPRDHGGRTSRGIIQREWDNYRRSHPDRPADVWQAPQADVEEIYKTQYWDPYCDKLPPGADLCFFNASVNSGRQQAVKELQRALGVNADGMMGMITFQAVADCQDLVGLVHAMSERRRAFYQSLRQFSIYGKGWMARTQRVEVSASLMAKNAAPSHPEIDTIPTHPEITVSAKANPSDTAKPPMSMQTATVSTTASAIGGSVSDQLQQASTAIQPLSEVFTWAKYICIGITVICAGFAIYAVIHNRKVQETV